MASTTRVSAAAECRRGGNLLQASVADGMSFSGHATIVSRRNGRNPLAAALPSTIILSMTNPKVLRTKAESAQCIHGERDDLRIAERPRLADQVAVELEMLSKPPSCSDAMNDR